MLQCKSLLVRTIKLVTKRNPFDPKRKRHAKWKCLNDGATVSELVAAMKKRGLSRPCSNLGLLRAPAKEAKPWLVSKVWVRASGNGFVSTESAPIR